jgi:hypothetical protein
MKRYLLFAFDKYYPKGGWEDFIGSFDTIEECKQLSMIERFYDEYQIIDSEIGLEILTMSPQCIHDSPGNNPKYIYNWEC